ncbi:MAG TPA: LysM peptidoglycan-binding domain-containing protein [Polyangiaceae bacterium]
MDASSKWAEQEKRGQKPELQYTGGERKKLAMELFFDTYEAKTDVREHTVKLSSLLVMDKEKHRPPKVTLSWGVGAPGGAFAEFPFTGVLESLKQQFTMFASDGTPVRAKLSVSFIQFSVTEEDLKKNRTNSSDKTKTYLVKEGDTVSDIAGLFYKDPAQWRHIADANQIENPRKLEPGRMLTIPAFE